MLAGWLDSALANFTGQTRAKTTVDASLPGTTKVTTFVVSNFSSEMSKGFIRLGLPFKKGDVPTGSALAISVDDRTIAAQFDERTTWNDGSLKFAVCHLRDRDFAGDEGRTYSVNRTLSSGFDNTGVKALGDISKAHRFNIAFENVQKYDGAATSVYGAGRFNADFNTHTNTATRVTKIHSGQVCEGWLVWGMATDANGTPDAHLKTNWHVDIWKNADGSVADIEFSVVVAQDWWSIKGKYLLNYTATLKDSEKVLQAYSNVTHPYNSHWITCRLQDDDNEGRRHWASGNCPTLVYKPDKSYWVSTGLVPPLNLALEPKSCATVSGNQGGPYTSHYIPCSGQNHRTDVDQTGSYPGRGLITNMDGIAFLRQTAADFRWARLNAYAGLHIPYHHRSNRSRVRRGEKADTANMIISTVMLPLSPNADNFTLDGMPAPVEAYAGSNTPSQYADSYVSPLGGTGVWRVAVPGQASHAVNFSYFMYLHEGERYFLDATIDLAANLVQQMDGTIYGGRPLTAYCDENWREFVDIFHPPNVQWSAIGSMLRASNIRAAGWAAAIFGSASALCPDNDIQKHYLIALNAHQFAWCIDGMRYMPKSMKDAGWWLQYDRGDFDYAPYMHNFVCLGSLFNFQLTECVDAKTLGAMTASVSIGLAEGGLYRAASMQLFGRPVTAPWNPITNDFFPRASAIINYFMTTISRMTNTLNAYDVLQGELPVREGDVLFPADVAYIYPKIAIPTELTPGKRYYIINLSGTKQNYTFQISEIPGGSPVIFTKDYPKTSAKRGGAYFGWFPAYSNDYTVADPEIYIPSADGFVAITRAALVMANRNGVTNATGALVSKAQKFLSTSRNSGDWVTWNFA